MSGPYVPSGPFVNSSPPALAAVVFNNVEAWIQQTEGAVGSSAISGSTSGTATIYETFQGVFKIVLVQTVNFRNGGGSAQTLAIPTPFTSIVILGKNSNINPFQLLKASTAQGVQQLITLNSGGVDNGVQLQTTLHANWIWHCDSGPDTISFNGSQGSAAGGHLLMIGI